MNREESEGLTLKRDYSIYKSNEIIQKARYDLSLQELKVLSFCISQIKPNDTIETTYTFSIVEFCKIAGIDYESGKNYSNVKNALTKLLSRVFWLTDPDGAEVSYHWIEKVRMHRGKGKIEIRFDEGLKKHLFGLMANYTQYELLCTLAMKSQYSFRLYELLKSYAFTHEYAVDVEELKTYLHAKQYANFKDFRVRVLELAIKEINLYTDIEISYEPLKNGKKISKIIFYIRQRDVWGQIENRDNARKALDSKKKIAPEEQQIEGQLNIEDYI